MEKPKINTETPRQEVLSPESRSSVSGVFDCISQLEDSHNPSETPQESIDKITQGVNVPKKEYQDLADEVLEKLEQLEAQEAAVKIEAKQTILKKMRAWASKNKLASTLLVAGALHSPIIARSSGFIDKIENAINTVKDWEKNGAFIMPQSAAEAKHATDQIYARGARMDREKKEAFENEQREKLERGEDVKLNETYLKLEEVNGEDPEKVKIAEQNKQEMIEKFAQIMGDDLSEEFIKSTVNEMFGSNENYEWGQGSVTEYFNTGKRNCLSISRAEQMVFEALIDRLPQEKRAKYQLGTAFEKQHEIAILKVLNPDGSIEKTYFLQPPVNDLVGKADRPGSPTVDLKTLQKAMVAKSAITISSNAKPGEIASSPDIITVGNQPVSTNIEIEGDLVASGYIERIVEERNIEIKWKEPSTTDKVMDLEIIHDDDVAKAQQKIAEAYKFIEAHEPTCENVNNCPPEDEIDRAIPYTNIDLSFIDWENLDKNQSGAIINELLKVREMPKPDAIDYGNINDASDNLIWNMPNLSISKEIVFNLKKDPKGNLSMEKTFRLIDQYNYLVRNVNSENIKDLPKIHLQYEEGINEGAIVDILKSFSGGELMLDQKNTTARPYYSENIVTAIVDSNVNNLYLEGSDLTPEGIQTIIDNPNKTYHFGLTAYVEIIRKRPDVVNIPHIKPWVDKLVVSLPRGIEIEIFRIGTDPDTWQKIGPTVEKLVEESIQKYDRGHYNDSDKK